MLVFSLQKDLWSCMEEGEAIWEKASLAPTHLHPIGLFRSRILQAVPSPTLKCNSIQYSWSDIQHHLEGLYQFKLQLELHQQLQDIQCLINQEIFQTLPDNLSWLNPKNLFDELNQNVGLWSHWLLTDYNNALCTSLHLQIIFPGSCERPASSKLCGIYRGPN